MIDRDQICELPKKQKTFPTHDQDVANWGQGAEKEPGALWFLTLPGWERNFETGRKGKDWS